MNGGTVVRFSILVVAEICFIAALNLFDDWTLEQMPVRFVGTAFAAGVAFLAAVSHFAPQLSIRRQAIIFWGVAVILRLVALPLAPADDLIRYQWDGKIQQAGFNPYRIAPSDSKLDALRREFPEASKINHAELPAFEAPGTELIFKLLSGATDRPLFYKLFFVIADLAVAGLLIRLIEGDHRYLLAAWYAWNPLVVYSFAGAAHFDSVMILALLGGILALNRACPDQQSNETRAANNDGRRWFWSAIAAICLGVAVSLNFVAASLFLFFIFALRWRAFVLAISVAIPLWMSSLFGYPNIQNWSSLGQVTYLSRLNDLFWWLIEDTVWPNPHQRVFHYFPVMIVCVVAASLLFIHNWRRGTVWSLGTVLVLSPILHPWYCTWILPFAAWRRAYGWHVLSITIFAYYLFWDDRLFALPWHAEPWMRLLIISPVLASLTMLTAQNRTAVEAA